MAPRSSLNHHHSNGNPENPDKELLDQLPCVAELLKSARLKRKDDINEIAATLRISVRYLIAIEENDFNVLPEQVYRLGFIRSYARYLGFSPDEIVEHYKHEHYPPLERQVLRFREPISTMALPKTWLVLVTVLLAGLVYSFWYFFYSAHESPQGIADDETHPPIDSSSPSSPAYESSSSRDPADDQETIEKHNPDTLEEGELEEGEAEEHSKASQEEETGLAQGPLKYEALEFEPGQKFSVKAESLSWFEMRDAQGQVIMSRNLKPEESVEFEARIGMKFSTGNAGGLRLITQEHITEPLGNKGEILRDQPLLFKAP